MDAAILCFCTDEAAATDAVVWLSEPAMLLLQAGSVEPASADAQARITRIQPFWKTLSAQSRMDLLSIPAAAVKEQAAEFSYKQQEAEQASRQQILEHATKHLAAEQSRNRGMKLGSAHKQGARLCFSCNVGHVGDAALRFKGPQYVEIQCTV